MWKKPEQIKEVVPHRMNGKQPLLVKPIKIEAEKRREDEWTEPWKNKSKGESAEGQVNQVIDLQEVKRDPGTWREAIQDEVASLHLKKEQ